ncbi:hypothetical protein KCU61_g494, partial [Aureobasidium melanogenum]
MDRSKLVPSSLIRYNRPRTTIMAQAASYLALPFSSSLSKCTEYAADFGSSKVGSSTCGKAARSTCPATIEELPVYYCFENCSKEALAKLSGSSSKTLRNTFSGPKRSTRSSRFCAHAPDASSPCLS